LDSEHGLDDVSWQILRELQDSARLSYSELGRRVGLTPPAVAERVRRLEEAGIIRGYRTEVDLERIGLPLIAFIRIATAEHSVVQFGTIAKDLPEVLECHRVTGDDSYITKVAVSSVRHLETLLNRLHPYGKTVTSIVLSSPVTHRVIGTPEASEGRGA